MALADIKQRPGIVLGVAVVLHVVLISAQVNTATGMPLLRVITFGAFSEVQRALNGGVTGVQDFWNGYIALRRVNDENAALRQQLQDLQIKLQEGENYALIEELQKRAKFTAAREVIRIDGLRVEYADGFGLARSSNTTPVIVLRFEADNEAALKRIQEDFRRVITEVKPARLAISTAARVAVSDPIWFTLTKMLLPMPSLMPRDNRSTLVTNRSSPTN